MAEFQGALASGTAASAQSDTRATPLPLPSPRGVVRPLHRWGKSGEMAYTPSRSSRNRGPPKIPVSGLQWSGEHDALPQVFDAQNCARWQFTDADFSDEEDEPGAVGMAAAAAAAAPPTPEQAPALPRLAIALMLRAAPASAVDGFVAYHHATGFEHIFLFFDAPEEDQEAVAVAQKYADDGGVTVHLCDDRWWADERRHGRMFARVRHAKQDGDRMAFRESMTVELGDDRKGDVQARQCLVMDRALIDATAMGFDWVLHIDIDELFHCPRRAQRDARRYFATVPETVDQVAFHNHELVPEKLETEQCWFTDNSLFKLNRHLVADFVGSEREEWMRQERKLRPHGRRYDDFRGHESMMEVLQPIESRRLEMARDLVKEGMRLPAPKKGSVHAARQADRERQDKDLRAAKEEAAIGGDDSGPDWREQMEAFRSKDAKEARANGKKKDDDDGFVKDYKPEDDNVSAYYNAYENGKCAVRIRPYPLLPPMAFSVHQFNYDNWGGCRTMSSDEAHDPVILHYANCSFDYWVRKYTVLGDFANERTSGQMNNMRAHLAARELVVRSSKSLQERFYRKWIMSDTEGELAHLACFGVVQRVTFARRLLRALFASGERPRPAATAGTPRGARVPLPLRSPTSLWTDEPPTLPIRPRTSQWRNVFGELVVTRERQNIKSGPVALWDAGATMWATRVTPKGYIVAADDSSVGYCIIDATHLGMKPVLAQVDPPEEDPGACAACHNAPCVCALIKCGLIADESVALEAKRAELVKGAAPGVEKVGHYGAGDFDGRMGRR